MPRQFANKNTQNLADELHKKLCQHDHTEQCDYLYGNWESGNVRDVMKQYYRAVEKLQEREVDVERSIRTLECAEAERAMLKKYVERSL